MTDNEIIKAFECCGIKGECNNCPFKKDEEKCEHINKYALDIINRQKAEIEALIAGQETLQKYVAKQKAEIERLTAMVEDAEDYLHPLPFKNAFDDEIARAKSEAIKAFAERLKEEGYYCEECGEAVVRCQDIDETAKELVGDNNVNNEKGGVRE